MRPTLFLLIAVASLAAPLETHAQPLAPDESWAYFYWKLRFWNQADQPGPPWYSFEYHTAHDLEGAITL